MRPTFADMLRYGLFLALPMSAAGQDKLPPASPPPASSPAPAAKPAAPEGDAGTYDPVSAEKDIDVGNFYMRKGDVDAAISRFKDAIQMRPKYAKPRLLLAGAYEKKKDKTNAVKYYKEYLQVFPHAPDANKIEKKIESLSAE